jgi:hypothetical protein
VNTLKNIVRIDMQNVFQKYQVGTDNVSNLINGLKLSWGEHCKKTCMSILEIVYVKYAWFKSADIRAYIEARAKLGNNKGSYATVLWWMHKIKNGLMSI